MYDKMDDNRKIDKIEDFLIKSQIQWKVIFTDTMIGLQAQLECNWKKK